MSWCHSAPKSIPSPNDNVDSLPPVTVLFILIFSVFWCYQCMRYVLEIRPLIKMHNFYTSLLDIPDQDMQTVSWNTVVSRIIRLRSTTPGILNAHPSLRLDAHNITNRIMRKENYMIAMINRDLLDLSVPWLRSRNVLTKSMEWNLQYCIVNWVFDDQHQVRSVFLKDTHRKELVQQLQNRFMWMAVINLVCAPFILVYLGLFFFFRYFEEYHKHPDEIGNRQYTPFARWKFREFDELPHIFQQRLNSSYEKAMLYINQFPKEKTAMLARFVSFVAGAFAGILALLTIYDQELLLGFEISPDKTVFFYIGVFGTILAVARGMIPDENIVFDPEHHLLQVMEHTHYYPEEWKNRLHSDDIRRQFSEFFDLKVSLFLQEFTSVLFTPLALWFSLPSCSEQIVDFFREFTVQVDGLGYVCSFSLFDFERHGNPKYGAPGHARSEYYVSKQGKMEKSFINFKAHNPDWEPEQASGSVFLQKVQSKPGLRKRAVGKTPLSKSVYNQPLDSITEHDMMHLAGLLGTRDLESDDEVPEQNHWGEGETEASTSNVYSLMNQFYNPRDDRM